MSSLLYFLPDNSPPPTALDGLPIITRQTTAGPDGQPGLIVCADSPDAKPAYCPDAQTWQKIAGQWLGYWHGDKPKPADFERKRIIPGHAVVLGDGNEWIIPIVKRFPTGTSLPFKLSANEYGEWIAEPLNEYASLIEAADRVFMEFLGENENPISHADAANMAVLSVSANYRIGQAETIALDLLTSDTVQDVLAALIDLPTIRQEAKKKRSGQPYMNSGETA